MTGWKKASLVLGVGAIVLSLIVLLLAGTVLKISQVSPGPGQVIGEAQPVIEVRFLGFPLTGGILVDTRPVPVAFERTRGRLVASAGPLTEGEHTVVVDLRTVLGRRVRKVWQIRVDRHGPSLTLETPASDQVTSVTPFPVTGRSDPGSRVRVNDEVTVADGSGRFEFKLPLQEGANDLVVTAVDEAGNEVTEKRDLFYDSVPPKLEVRVPVAGEKITDPRTGLEIMVEDNHQVKRVMAAIDTRRPVGLEGRSGLYTYPIGDLAEGLRKVVLTAEDEAGQVSELEIELLIDTSEKFGEKVMTRGAVGRDVEGLQRRLTTLGFLEELDQTGLFDERTYQALNNCQKKYALAADGVVGPATMALLGPHIYVNLAEFSLVLEDPGAKSRRFPIAHGLPDHPTPTGEFRVVEKVQDPTWIPPDSPWAREAEVTPPGADNPLGTRWLGLDSNLVGIHGTPFSGSIGTRASHGCIRMRMKDVEALYELVNVNTPVTILKGDEDVCRRLWP